MASPTAISLVKDTWTKIATAVTQGNVWIVEPKPSYSHYYAVTGASPSAATMTANASPMPEPGLPISCDEKCDIYVRANGYAGKVVVAI